VQLLSVKFQQRYQMRHAISLSPLIDWIFGLWATPKMAPHLVHQFWGSNSVESARREESFHRFEVACAE
jgi:hypothetical protein